MASRTETKRIPFNTISQALDQSIAGADPARAVGLQDLHRVRAAKTTGMEREQARLSQKLGARDPRVLALNQRIESNRSFVRDLSIEIDHARTEAPVADENTWIVHGFVRDKDLTGVPNLTVAIYDEKGTWIQALGFACTDARGYFKLSFSRTDKTEDSEKPTVSIAAVAGTATRGPEVFIHVLDKTGTHICIDKRPLTPQLGNVDYREIILGNGTCRPPEDATAPKPGPQDPAGPVVTRPPHVEGLVTPPARPAPTPPGPRPPAPTPAPQPPAPQPPAPQPPAPQPPAPQPPAPVRTPLNKLDIDETTRKLLMEGGIRDIEGVLEAEPENLATIVGSKDMAKKLIQMARQLLGSTATAPPPPPKVRTDLAALGVDAPLRKKLEDGGVRDVEAMLEVGPAKLAQIVGDRAAAAKLTETARNVLAGTPAPAPTSGVGRPTGKKTTSKKPK